jgi:hypothetical protein
MRREEDVARIEELRNEFRMSIVSLKEREITTPWQDGRII